MITKTLDLSTVHITRKTNDWLIANAPTEDQLNDPDKHIGFCVRFVVRHDYGFIFFISEDIFKDGGYEEVKLKAPELFNIIRYAIDQGCSMINLDRDGESILLLKKFKWK